MYSPMQEAQAGELRRLKLNSLTVASPLCSGADHPQLIHYSPSAQSRSCAFPLLSGDSNGCPQIQIRCSPIAETFAKSSTIDIECNAVHPYYRSHADFPYLGQKLLAVQNFVKCQNPIEWKALWCDRRSKFLVDVLGNTTPIQTLT